MYLKLSQEQSKSWFSVQSFPPNTYKLFPTNEVVCKTRLIGESGSIVLYIF